MLKRMVPFFQATTTVDPNLIHQFTFTPDEGVSSTVPGAPGFNNVLNESFSYNGTDYVITRSFTHDNNGHQLRFNTNANALQFIADDVLVDPGVSGQDAYKSSLMDNRSAINAAQYTTYAGRYTTLVPVTVTISRIPPTPVGPAATFTLTAPGSSGTMYATANAIGTPTNNLVSGSTTFIARTVNATVTLLAFSDRNDTVTLLLEDVPDLNGESATIRRYVPDRIVITNVTTPTRKLTVTPNSWNQFETGHRTTYLATLGEFGIDTSISGNSATGVFVANQNIKVDFYYD